MAAILGYIAIGTGMTVLLTFASAVIGIVLAAPLTACAFSRFSLLRGVYTGLVHFIRGVPTLVWLFIFFFGVGELGLTLQPVTASLLTLSLTATAYVAEIYRGGMQAIHPGQWEAAGALNMNEVSTLRDIIAPQLFRAVSPSVATQVIGLLKDSALVSTIGVTDLVFRAGVMTQHHGHGLYMFGFAGLIYLALSIPVAVFSRYVDTRIKRRYAI